MTRPMLRFLLLLVGLNGVPWETAAAPWSARAVLPEARQEVAVATLGGQVYVIGGFRSDASIADTVEVYDPQTDTWGSVTPLPIALHHAGAVAQGGRLYVMGGFSDVLFVAPLDRVFEYDPNADSWSEKASMPNPRGSFAVGLLDGLIYVAGGSPAAREQDLAVYDPGLDSWTVLPSMPTPRNHLSGGTIDGRFYAAGGRSGGIGGITSALEEYEPISQTWTSRAPMPTARGGVAGAVVGDRLFVFGGEGNPGDPSGVFPQTEVYDVVSDSWTSRAPMPTPRHGTGAAVVNGLIYIPGGATTQGFGVSDAHEVFDPSDEPIAVPALPGAARDLLVVLLIAGFLWVRPRARRRSSPRLL